MYSITKSNKNIKHPPIIKKTLDTQHTNKMQQIKNTENIIKNLENKINELKNKLSKYENKKNELNDKDIEYMINLKDEISILEKELKNINPNIDEINYLIETGNILFKYYDIIDKGKSKDNSILINRKINQNSILNYLINNQNKDEILKTEIDDKATLLDKYMEYTEDNYVKNIEFENKDKCLSCKSINRNVMLNDGIIYCNDCHTVEYILIDHDRPSYKDPPRFLWAEKSYCGNYQNMFPIKQLSVLILIFLLIIRIYYG